MEDTGYNGFLIQLQICQNDRHTQGVDNIWLSGFSLLILMGVSGDMVCLFYHAQII